MMSSSGGEVRLFELQAAWRELESKRGDQLWNALRLPLSDGRTPLVVVDTRGLRHFLVPAERRPYSTNTNSPLSLDVGEHAFTFIDGSKETGRFVDISCVTPQLNEQFDTVILSICEEFEEGVELAETAVRVVGRWRELFSYLSSTRALTTQEKLGAFAELLVLEEIVRSSEVFSIDYWTGPLGEPHDFELPTVSIEAKGLGTEARTISVHGLKQLERAEDKPLWLWIIELELDSTGMTVGELLDRIASDSPFEHEIRRRAAAAGIFRSQSDEDRFTVRRIARTKVDESFPRLIVSGEEKFPFSEAFRNVRYEIELAAFTDLLTFEEDLDFKETIDG